MPAGSNCRTHLETSAWFVTSNARTPPGPPAAQTVSPRASSARTRCRPTNPSAPVTRTFISARAFPEALEIGVDHHVDELAEVDRGFPAESCAGLCRVSDQEIHLGGTNESLIDDDVLLPIEANPGKGNLAELLDSVALLSGDEVVVGMRLLEHPPDCVDVVAGKSPVAMRIQVAHRQRPLQAELDPGRSVGDLARDELEASSGRLVVEEDPAHRVEAEALPVVHGDVVAVDLRDPVRRPWIERGELGLRRFP